MAQNFSWLQQVGHEYNNKQETSEVQFEEYALRLNAGDFASRSKAKAKPQRRDSASSSTRTIRIGERTWTDVEPGDYPISDYEVSKKLIRLLRHGSLPSEGDGAIEFWRIKDNLQKHFLYCQNWSDEKWKKSMARGGGNKKNTSIVLIHQEQSCISELFKVIHDAVSYAQRHPPFSKPSPTSHSSRAVCAVLSWS